MANSEVEEITGEKYQIGIRRKYEAYIDFLVKENKELKAQIEKMKCCQNCELYDCTSECKNKKCKYQYSEICRQNYD